ncbi:nickel pincer cofactor biosynthesis protein LarB [Candidatus Sumerlaeota bacterium]|nr:nickel pincer cofactor biosynthesis protein LarB [Candidatus Sumerlaeota bacterium]
MNPETLSDLLNGVRDGSVSIEDATERISRLPYVDLGYAKVDLHRRLRRHAAEVIYCEGKRPEQIAGIVGQLAEAGQTILGTRASRTVYEKCLEVAPGLEYNEIGRCFYKVNESRPPKEGRIAVVAAGTSDMPVAEEAAVTAEVLGSPVDRVYDVGVAGIHRLLGESHVLDKARVVVAVAGMEGAMPSVVGGLVSCPVIAVPTSVGYGASFGGLSALLGMLNSCASNVTVVNIDNGFGAAYVANLINRP